MSEKSDNIIDPDLKEELENTPMEDMIAEYGVGSAEGDDRTEFVESWFPDSNEWQGKTNITARQAQMMALARNLGKEYGEELGITAEFLVDVIDDYEKYLTSVDGLAREQQAGILRSMFGGASEETEETRGMIMGALAGNLEDDDND